MTMIFTSTGAGLHAGRVPESFHIRDIACALSHTCRFKGFSSKFYSVAQHTCILADLIADSHPALVGVALLHDASEAYMFDIPTPWKHHTMFREIVKLDGDIQRRIYTYFGVGWDHTPSVLHELDRRLMLTEADQLGFDITKFDVRYGTTASALPIKIDPWGPGRSRTELYSRLRKHFPFRRKRIKTKRKMA